MRLHNRQIKATFWNDPDLLQMNRDKRWFYEGLTQLADDSGCLEDSPFAFKLHLFPSPLDSDITVDILTQWRDELIQLGKLVPYTSKNKQCLFILNFHKHQALRSPAPPDVPLPEWIGWTPPDKPRGSGTYQVNNPYAHRTLTVSSEYTDQPEPEREPEREPEITPQPPLKCPYSEIVELYHANCPSLPRVRDITDTRKKHMKARWKRYDDLPTYDVLFKKAEESDFLSGRNGVWTNCNFDWLINESNMVKVLEGNYDNKAQPNPPPKPNMPKAFTGLQEWGETG